jgi:hypothetical protein
VFLKKVHISNAVVNKVLRALIIFELNEFEETGYGGNKTNVS